MKIPNNGTTLGATGATDFSLPYDRLADLNQTELEESVLGGIMFDAWAADEPLGIRYVSELLPPDAFQHRNHRVIYSYCLELHSVGLKPTTMAVRVKLAQDGRLEEVGGPRKLAQLDERDNNLSIIDLKQNASLLKEAYQRRQLSEALNGINKEKDFDTALDRLQSELDKLRKARSKPDLSERLRLELHQLLGETDFVKVLQQRADIACRYRIKASDIDQALKFLQHQTEVSQTRCLLIDELFDLPQTGKDYLIPGMLPVGDAVLLVADPKCGKTLLAYDAAFAIATGESEFLGEQCKQGRVLIIQTDEAIGTARGRLFKRGFRHEDRDNVRFMDRFSIDQLPELEKILEEFRPSLVIIDSLRRINVGRVISENSAEFADQIYKLKELLTRYNASGILIHHNNKNGDAVGTQRVRGSSAIGGAVWGIWQLDNLLHPDPNNKKKLIIDPKDSTRIFSVTARDVEGQRLKIELDPENNHWLNRGEPEAEESAANKKTQEDQIIALLKPISPRGMEACELSELLGIGRSIYQILNRLVGKGIIGTRPSAIDKRRTVYYYPSGGSSDCDSNPTPPGADHKPQDIDHKPQDIDHKPQGDPPHPLPPPVCDQICDQSSETFTQSRLEIDHKIDHKPQEIDHKPQEVDHKPQGLKAPKLAETNPGQGFERLITNLNAGGGSGSPASRDQSCESPSESPSEPQSQPVSVVVPGQRVRVHCRGSKRNGKVGTVLKIEARGVVVLLDDDGTIPLRLRRWEGVQMSWIEVL